MANLKEKYLGAISLDTFRPSEAQKAVLLNIDRLSTNGQRVTEQDAINVPAEDLKTSQLSRENLDSAYEILIKIGVIEVIEDLVTLTPEGLQVVEEVKSAQQSESDESPEDDLGLGDELGLEKEPGAEPESNSQSSPDEDLDFGAPPRRESRELLLKINDMVRLQESVEKLNKES